MADSGGRMPRYDPQEQIKQVILERGLPPGAAIPTEIELVAELGISRGSLREALKGLQARGIIDVQHGRGMFVGRPSMDSMVDGLIFHGRLDEHRDDLTTVAELVEVRQILECALVTRVAADAPADLLADLEETVGAMERAPAGGPEFQEADRIFHDLLYSRLGNVLVRQLVRAFWDVLDAVGPDLSTGASDHDANVAHHRAILECVRDGDPAGAGAAMTDHFRGTMTWIRASTQGRRS